MKNRITSTSLLIALAFALCPILSYSQSVQTSYFKGRKLVNDSTEADLIRVVSTIESELYNFKNIIRIKS